MKRITFALLLSAAASLAPLAASPISFEFTINTTSLAGQADYLDFQLNPGGLTSLPVTVQISGLSLNGGSFVAGNLQPSGDVSGSLPNNLLIDNGSAGGFNDAFQPATLGTSVSFLATFSGLGVDTPGSPGTSFLFSIYDSAGINPLLTTATAGDGSIAGVVIDSLGVVPYTNPATPGAGSAAVISQAPEPGSITLIGLGMAGLGALLRRKR